MATGVEIPRTESSEVSRERAFELIRDGHRLIADGFHVLSLIAEQPAPASPVSGAGVELLSREEAARLVGVTLRGVDMLTIGKPCRRYFGRRVRIEKAGLLKLARRG